MNQDAEQPRDQGPARRDGLAAVAIILVTLVLIIVVVSALI